MGPYVLELNITSPYVDSRVDTNICTTSNPMPESTLSPSQGLRILPHFNIFATDRKKTLQKYPHCVQQTTVAVQDYLSNPAAELCVVSNEAEG
jgi:hypothetical protein